MRCFVAIELPAGIRTALAALIRRWEPGARGVRFSREEQLHVTLRFLGEVAPESVGPISAVVASAARLVEPFSLHFSGLGAFPTRAAPRVLWFGAADAAQGCARWLIQAQPGLIELGFAEESRPLHPHVTLARVNAPAGVRALRQILGDPPPDVAFTLPIRDLTLFESQLGRNGATYRPLGRFPLGIRDLDASNARD